jgi:hypothetical protein
VIYAKENLGCGIWAELDDARAAAVEEVALGADLTLPSRHNVHTRKAMRPSK